MRASPRRTTPGDTSVARTTLLASAPGRSPLAAAGGRPGGGRGGRSAPSDVTSIFGASTVAAIPTIKAAALVVGGIPMGGWIDDPPLRGMLLDAAARLQHAQVLMLNVTNDEFFPTDGSHAFFDAIPGRKKRLMFWEGDHDDWPAEAIRLSIDFLNRNSVQ